MNAQSDNIVPIQNKPVVAGASQSQSGCVLEITPQFLLIECDNKTVQAQKAFSCLIEPEVNDIVMLCTDQHQQSFIIAVLQRQQSDQATLSVPQRTVIHSDQKLTFSSPEINQISDSALMKTRNLVSEFDQAVVKGSKLHSHIRHLHVVSDMISTMAKQAIQKFSSYVRKTDGSDQVQATQMSRKVDGLYNMNSKHTILVSQKDTKIDGEHIHMG